MSNSVRPHRQKATRLHHPWDSPGKNTRVGCHFLLQCRKVKRESEVAQLCLTFRDPMDCSPPGSSIHVILQARTLEWVAISFSNLGHGWSLILRFTLGYRLSQVLGQCWLWSYFRWNLELFSLRMLIVKTWNNSRGDYGTMVLWQ